MTTNPLLNFLTDDSVRHVKVGFADIDGVLRGKVIHKEKFLDSLTNGLRFCDVTFGWDTQDALYEQPSVTGWHTGFPDTTCYPDLSTARLVPYQENTPFVLADFGEGGASFCPRTLLRTVAARCQQMGYHAECAQEFEWYNFKETPQSIREKGYRDLRPLSPGMFGYSLLRTSQHSEYYYDLFRQFEGLNIELEGLHTETGPGVYEAAIAHAPLRRSADEAFLFKSAVKEIAALHGITASFMAKFNASLPGCSGHIHQSLWSADGKRNMFYDAAAPHKMSQLMEHFLAGQLYCLPFIMPMYAPTINSYKRLVEGAWAPTRLSWGVENRTCAVRVINNHEKYTRLEMRVPGSDSNPYLAIAASLASGLYGVANKLPLELPLVTGNAYAQSDALRLPSDLKAATDKMKGSEIAAQLFGADFCAHFIQSREWEWKQYAASVSDWELSRYFEII